MHKACILPQSLLFSLPKLYTVFHYGTVVPDNVMIINPCTDRPMYNRFLTNLKRDKIHIKLTIWCCGERVCVKMINFRRCLFLINVTVFLHLNLDIASKFPVSNYWNMARIIQQHKGYDQVSAHFAKLAMVHFLEGSWILVAPPHSVCSRTQSLWIA